jgi:UDP-N-acetylmuramoylalanine-D-glutamate ligase
MVPGAEFRTGFDEAVRRAVELARPGDTVLLSPGFSSYDQFPGFDARGARFKELVNIEGALFDRCRDRPIISG